MARLFRLKVNLNYPTDPGIIKRLKNGEHIPLAERGLKKAEVGDVVDDIPAVSVEWLMEKGYIEEVRLKQHGGGWYELPSGEKVQGLDAALERMGTSG